MSVQMENQRPLQSRVGAVSNLPNGANGGLLSGFVSRKVTARQVNKALGHGLNPFTNTRHTHRYKKLLDIRRKLPVFAQMDEFYKLFSANQISVIVGETGTGKTTQIPQFVAFSDLPHIKGKVIACTQPRRVAATTVAKRVAEEMDVRLGEQVGYSVRFEDVTNLDTTFLQYMTDGMLLREVIKDRDLSRYSTIILDEAHERTIATDLLMALLKSLAKRRADLKIIVMSATLDVLKFQTYFASDGGAIAPLLKIRGRVHPVEIEYLDEPAPDYVQAAIQKVLTIHSTEGPGDVLLFLTGEEEVEDTCRKIKKAVYKAAERDPEFSGPLDCVPLYSSLPSYMQQRVFDPAPRSETPDGPPGRKVVVSTNIAETSLTIDGIVYVIDPGFAKQKAYHPLIHIESLLVNQISKSSAHQRAGRAGRTCPGKCFRLYTEKDHNLDFEEQTRPEILRSNLAGTVLELVKLGIKDLVQFDYLDAPSEETLLRAVELLRHVEALDGDNNLTALGNIMVEFPLEPQLSKMLAKSPEFQCSNEILTITAMLSVPPVFLRPYDQRARADAAKALLTVPGGDHLTLLNVYNAYIENKSDNTWVWKHFLSIRALCEAEKVRQQLQQIMRRCDIPLVTTSGEDEERRMINIKKALCCGFFFQAAHRQGPNYLTVKDNQSVALHPSCTLVKQKPVWVIFDKVLLTSGRYLRTVTDVDLEWLLEIAPDYFDPESFPEGTTKLLLGRGADTVGAAKKKKEKKEKKKQEKREKREERKQEKKKRKLLKKQQKMNAL